MQSQKPCVPNGYNMVQKLRGRIQIKMYFNRARAAWCIWGPKAKISYLVSYIKLLLININHVEFKKKKKLTKLWCGRLIVVSKRVMSVVNLVEN